MRSWPRPTLPTVDGEGVPLRLHDVARDEVRPVEVRGDHARLYVCGVTPYDTTHLGHAATYVTFDLVHRALLDAGHEVSYVQNVTDIDDPLLERAARDGIDWRELAQDQTGLYTEDMAALAVIPPDHLVGVVESMEVIVAAVTALREEGATYEVVDESTGARDTYLDLSVTAGAGVLCHLPREEMTVLTAERGGDPERPGKRDPLDPLLWRGAREGEPAWPGGVLGEGRPGWHIECTAIAMHHLGPQIDVQGGGSDLVFPHHEMSVLQAEAITHDPPFAGHTTHQAMVGYDGEKMSKSKGNLVRVSTLRAEGHDPAAIRLALLGHHYRTDWEWTPEDLPAAETRLARWREAFARPSGPAAGPTLEAVRARIADDLDTVGAVAEVDAWVDAALSETADPTSPADPAAPGEVAALCRALLGLPL